MDLTPAETAITYLIGEIGASILYLVSGRLLPIVSFLVVIIIMYAGIQYIIGGTKGQENAKGTIISALVGLVVVALSYALASFVLNFLGNI